MKRYFLISLKHTRATDQFITLWRDNNAGYTLSLKGAGLYHNIEPGYHDSENTLPVEYSTAMECAINDPDYIQVLPNDSFTRETLGLQITNNKLTRIN